MSRPPDEYFAEPGPAPGEPPADYFDDRPPELDALIDAVAAVVDEAPIRGMHCDRLFIDEMLMACGRRNGKQAALDEALRLGRKAGLLPPPPPVPPEWFVPGPGSRLLYDIPSVPELEMYRNRCLAWLTFAPGGWQWQTAYHALEEAERALDDARWRVACESYRWMRDYPTLDDDDLYWLVLVSVAALRYKVLSECPQECSPGRDLAVRQVTG